jgi:Holliday junction resolvase RusA-like endonuclease
MPTIVLSGEPKSTQHIYKYACRGNYPTMYMTAEGRAIKEAYQWEAKSQWRAKSLAGDVALTITFYFGSKRRRDLDNQNKLVLDALTGIVYEDDHQIAELCLRRRYGEPRIEVIAAALQKA